jgi:hypothetical protein
MTEIEMTSLLLKLANLGVTGIKVHYDGGGDSGAIEDISYTTEPCETPDDVDEKVEIGWGSKNNLADLDQEAYAAIEKFAYKILDDIEDWWNNEGGFGDLSICVPSGKYMIDNHVRYYQTEDYQHEGSLIEKSAD